MTWTYDAATRSDRNRVRENIGDTDTSDQQLADEIIDEKLTDTGSVNSASIACIKLLMAKYVRLVSQTTGPISVQHSNRLAAYKEMMALLKSDGQFAAGFCGGISVSDKETREADTDTVQPSFTRGMFDNPAAGAIS
jgi:hypothetical protein